MWDVDKLNIVSIFNSHWYFFGVQLGARIDLIEPRAEFHIFYTEQIFAL